MMMMMTMAHTKSANELFTHIYRSRSDIDAEVNVIAAAAVIVVIVVSEAVDKRLGLAKSRHIFI